jgi:hypothetical protein
MTRPGIRGVFLGRALVSLASLWLSVACAAPPPASPRDLSDANDTGSRLEASPSDRALLARLSAMPSGTPRQVGDATVVADAAYAAASGRECRLLHLTRPQGHSTIDQLACSDGGDWFWVPDVFAARLKSE